MVTMSQHCSSYMNHFQHGQGKEKFHVFVLVNGFFFSQNLITLLNQKPIDRICIIIPICPLIRHTDNHFRLAIVVVALLCLRQSRARNIDCCTSEIWPWLVTLTLAFDHWPWPWLLAVTYNPNLVMVDLHTKYQGCMSNGLGVRVVTVGHYQVNYLPTFKATRWMVDLRLEIMVWG